MQDPIQQIILPVRFNASHRLLARQAAELALEHGASLHLLLIENTAFAWSAGLLPWITLGENFYDSVHKKMGLLKSWKRWLEEEFPIPIKTSLEWGSWKKSIVRYAHQHSADMIVLPEPRLRKSSWYRFWRTPYEYILEESPCQILTMLQDKADISQWKQVVIPITRSVPEKRLQAILQAASTWRMKIHLVTLASREEEGRSSSFYYLTETLKRLKHGGRVQVECQCLPANAHPARVFLQYAESIRADALFTNLGYHHQQYHPQNPQGHTGLIAPYQHPAMAMPV
ncbi:MAG TPA: universal stress protein [Sediminibacterium sp.]|nr:universal stress protein [Sediminibacterium sp.]